MAKCEEAPKSGCFEANKRLQDMRVQLEAAQHKAQALGQAVLVRVHRCFALGDPWALLRSGSVGQSVAPAVALNASKSHPQPDALQPGPYIAWHDPKVGLTMLGMGRAAHRDLEAAEGLEPLQAYPHSMQDRMVHIGDTEALAALPIWWVRAGFGEEDPRPAGIWSAWPRASLTVPEQLVYRMQTGPKAEISGAMVSGWLSAEDDLDAWSAAVHTSLDALQHRMDAASSQPQATSTPQAGLDACVAEQPLETQSSWEARVLAAKNAIRKGAVCQGEVQKAQELQKVVLARGMDVAPQDGHRFDPEATACALRLQHPEAMVFALRETDGSVFVGATPETLVRIDGDSLWAHALAGTQARSEDAKQDAALGAKLLASAKDRREHAMVAEALRQDLRAGGVALGENDQEVPTLRKLRRVQHLETVFEGQCAKPSSVLTWAQTLHPTPSVGGWPRAEAQAWLQAHEPLERGGYAGWMGWLGGMGDRGISSGVLAVALRSVLFRGRTARLFAGAGIVADSDPKAEWDETVLKMGTAGEALCMRRFDADGESYPVAALPAILQQAMQSTGS